MGSNDLWTTLACDMSSVTRLGDLLHFGQLSKACGSNYFAQIAHILGNFCKCVKMFHFYCEIIFGQLLYTFGDFLLVTLDMSTHNTLVVAGDRTQGFSNDIAYWLPLKFLLFPRQAG